MGGPGTLSVQKNVKITRTVPILKSKSTSFSFFFTIQIKKIVKGGSWGAGRGCFFLHITILFHQCNDKNIIYQQFYCCLRSIFYT